MVVVLKMSDYFILFCVILLIWMKKSKTKKTSHLQKAETMAESSDQIDKSKKNAAATASCIVEEFFIFE